MGPRLPHLAHGVRAEARHPGARDRGAAVLDRSQPLPHLLRGGNPRGPVDGAAAQDVPPHQLAGVRPGCARVHRDGLRGGESRGRGRPASRPRRAAGGAQSSGRRARDRTSRPRGEPVRGHEVAWRLRDPGGDHPARGPPGARVADPRPRGRAAARFPRSAVRRDHLLRLLVRPGARGPPDARGRHPEGRDGHGEAQALQGHGHRGGAALAALALPDGFRDLRGGPRLPAEGRRGLHQSQCSSPQDPRPPGRRPIGPRLLPMRVHVALTPGEFPRLALAGRTALVVDVLRATTTVVAACVAGCAGVIPVATPEEARDVAARCPGLLLAGERNGEAIEDFDLGNSPLECTPARVGGRTLVLTTTNGTGAMLKAREADAVAVAALTNVSAAAVWAARRGQDVTVLCAGEKGAFSLEDAVCAGLLVEQLCAEEGTEPSGEALAAQALGRLYGSRLDRLAPDSPRA